MEVIIKYALDDVATVGTTGNIPYPDAAPGEILWTAGTYNQGDQRVQDGNIYEVVASSTSDTIDAGLVASPATWIYVKPANFYAALRNENDFKSSYADEVQYVFTASGLSTGVAFFGVEGESVTVQVNNTTVDPVNPIYNETQTAADNSEVYDWWSYWTLPSNTKETFYFNDLPIYTGSTVTMTVNAPSGTAKLGNLIVGELVDLGVTLTGMSPQLRSTSRYIDDAFGNRTTISRGSVRELEATVKYPTAKHDNIYRRIESMNDIPTAWAGTSKFSTSIILGTGEATFELYPYENSDATYTIKRYVNNAG